MSRVVYCSECEFATPVKNVDKITPMQHTDSCSRRHIKSSIAYAMAFGIPMPIEVDDVPPRGLTINQWRRAHNLPDYPEERVDINNLRADSGWLYVDQPNCGCGVDVSDIPIELTITSYVKDTTTSTVICMQWHTRCYLNSFVEV